MKRRLWNRRTFVATSVAGGLGVATIGPWGFNFLMDRVDEIGREIPAAPYKPTPASWADNAVTMAWLGHATVLINFFGVRILTRPRALPAHRSGFTARITRAAPSRPMRARPRRASRHRSRARLARALRPSRYAVSAGTRGPGGCHGPRHVRPSAPPPLLVGQRASLERDGTCDHASWRGHRSCNRGKALGRTNSPRHLARLHRVGR